jgi:hypothetical protein
MPVFEHGHFDGVTNAGWNVGHFVTGPRHSFDTEVKLAHHDPGPAGKGWSVCDIATTLSVLISGKFQIEFRTGTDAEIETVLLEPQGDYVIFGSGMQHRSTALEKSVFLTVRWPSLRDDCHLVEAVR